MESTTRTAIITYTLSYASKSSNQSFAYHANTVAEIDVSDTPAGAEKMLEVIKERLAEMNLGKNYRNKYTAINVVVDNLIWM